MAKKYGVTWWGQQWLHYLTLIDYSKRLPLGKGLANSGKVRSIDVKGNQINAKVQGAQPMPFRVGISVPLFTAAEKNRLAEAIAESPALLDKISRRELPQELLKIAESQHIKIFPESWKDFSLHCSCPDLAVPCEHMAAVIYEVAEEIDKNPFMVFEVHEMHLLKELNDYYNQLSEKKSEQITTVDSLLLPKPPAQQVFDESEPIPTPPPPATHLDFTLLPEVGSHLIRLFKPPSIFEEIDLLEAVVDCYESAAEHAERFLSGNFPVADITGSIVPGDQLQLVVDAQLFPKKLHVLDEKNKPARVHADELLHLLLEYDLEAPGKTLPSVKAVLDVLSFSLHLAVRGAILPQLLACEPGTYRIRWIPLLAMEELRMVFEKLADTLPPDLLVVEKNGVAHLLSPAETLNTLCSVFIGDCIRGNISLGNHPVLRMLHGIYSDAVQPIEEEALAQSLQRWLQPFFPTRKEFAPVIRVEDQEGEYAVELLIEQRSAPLVPPVSYSQFLQQKRFENVKEEVLKDLESLADIYPPIHKIISSEGKHRPNYNSTRFLDMLVNTLPMMEVFGIKTILPAGMEEAVRPRVALLARRLTRKRAIGYVPLEAQLGFDWQIALGNEMITVKDFEKLVKNDDGVVKWHDNYVLVDEDELIDLFDKLDEPPMLAGTELLQALLAEEYQNTQVSLSADAVAVLREYTQPAKTNLPRGMAEDLYFHQLVTYDWLLKNARLGFGSLLADDLGLGKTLPVLAALLKWKEEGMLKSKKALIIAPAALHANWWKEIEKFAPKLKAYAYSDLHKADSEVIIASYGTLRSEVETLRQTTWHCIVLDEAQRISNPHSELSNNVKSLPAENRIALCSTEVENNMAALWSMMDFTNPGYLGTWRQFTNDFVHPIRRDHEQRRAIYLKKIIAPFLLRRRKSDELELADMPKKIEHRQFATLIPEQAALYENLAKKGLAAVYDEKDAQRRQSIALQLVVALKQICNHPYQYLKKGSTLPGLSGKVELLFSLLENMYANGEKVVILTQFQETGELLLRYVKEEFGKEPMLLHGSTTRPVREEMVEVFQQNPEFDTLVISLKMASSDLNLQAASHLIHFDSWWNPVLDEHASRMTLSPGAMTWRLITKGSLEEKIDAMFQWRKDLAELTATAGESWLGNLSDEELEELVLL